MTIEVNGHRGARFEVPENTLVGFRHAIALGLESVEFDVRSTADGELVVIHDATVDRTTNGTGKVSQMTLAEIRELDARSIHTSWPDPVHVPTLAEVLETLRPMPSMEIEIKRDTADGLEYEVPAIIAAIRAAGRSETATITSFDPYALELAQKHAPEIKRGMIGDWSDSTLWYLARLFHVSRACINLGTATPELVQRARDEGYLTVGWPCNDEHAVRTVLSCGFDAICTDAPTIFAPLLGKKINALADRYAYS